MKPIPTRTLAAVLIASATLALSACGDRVLDFRNAQVVNGQIYAGNANEPFTGNVTNVPNAVVFNDTGYSAFNDVITRAYGSVMQLAHPGLNLDQFVRQSAALFLDTGLTFVGTTAPHVLCTVHVDGGKITGDVSCTQAGTDNVAITASIGTGGFDGPVKLYTYSDGKQYPFVSATLKDGKLDGGVAIYSPETHRQIYDVTFAEGQAAGPEKMLDENTGKPLQEVTYANGRQDGDYMRWAPGGEQVVLKGRYANGLLDGQQDSFDPVTGRKITEAHWSAGKLDGEARVWDAQGNLVTLKTFHNGFLATSSDPRDIRTAEGQDPNKPAVLVPLPASLTDTRAGELQTGSANAAAVPTNGDIAGQIRAAEDDAPSPEPAPQPVQPGPVALPPASVTVATTPSRPADDKVQDLVADGPAVKRCGWIENDMPSSLTLKDRDGTWSIVGAKMGGQPDGFDTMPATDKGDSCGCLMVQTNRAVMRVVRVFGGTLKPAAACQQDKSLR